VESRPARLDFRHGNRDRRGGRRGRAGCPRHRPGNLAAILQMIRAGLGYANMHTPLHPGGEIRGQIRVVGGSDRD